LVLATSADTAMDLDLSQDITLVTDLDV